MDLNKRQWLSLQIKAGGNVKQLNVLTLYCPQVFAGNHQWSVCHFLTHRLQIRYWFKARCISATVGLCCISLAEGLSPDRRLPKKPALAVCFQTSLSCERKPPRPNKTLSAESYTTKPPDIISPTTNPTRGLPILKNSLNMRIRGLMLQFLLKTPA